MKANDFALGRSDALGRADAVDEEGVGLPGLVSMAFWRRPMARVCSWHSLSGFEQIKLLDEAAEGCWIDLLAPRGTFSIQSGGRPRRG